MLGRSAWGLLLVAAGPLFGAGVGGATLSGRVSNGTTPVADAIVTVSRAGFVKSVTTDPDGRFVLPSIPPGQYGFRTTAHGFAVYECPAIVRSGDARRNWIEIKQLIPAGSESVSVVELAPRKQAGNVSHPATRAGL